MPTRVNPTESRRPVPRRAAPFKLSKTVVDGIQCPGTGQVLYWDRDLKGFGLRVGSNTKAYFAEGRVHGRTVRFTIGRHGVFSAEQARTEAREALRLMAKNINPNDDKAEKRAKGATLDDAFKAFEEARGPKLKERTLYDYKRVMRVHFNDWKKKPLTEITKDMVKKRHRKLGEASEAQANLAMRFLRALFNFARGEYDDSKGRPIIVENPVRGLSEARSWYRVERRNTVIKAGDLKAWYDAVQSLKNDHTTKKRESVRDYLLLLLFTGLRRQEAARLAWDRVDLKAKTLTVVDTKNRDDHTLPLSDFLFDMLTKRWENAELDKEGELVNAYVFPGDGKRGYIVEPRNAMGLVTTESKVEFTLHDLRRTFTTIAEGLDISTYSLKRLLNHRMMQDVTAGYVITNVERLRAPMQQITDFVLRTVGANPSAEVVSIRREKTRKKVARA